MNSYCCTLFYIHPESFVWFFFNQGIRSELNDEMVERKPRTSSRSGIKSTIYQAFSGEVQFFLKQVGIPRLSPLYSHVAFTRVLTFIGLKFCYLGWHSFLVYSALCVSRPLPDMMVPSAGPSLWSMRPQPAIANVLHELEEMTLSDSRCWSSALRVSAVISVSPNCHQRDSTSSRYACIPSNPNKINSIAQSF